jgi:hypothetical protein
MDYSHAYGITFDGPARYRILIKGGIPGNWSDRMDGMSIRQHEADDGEPVTILEGDLADQAALTGVINTLYALHLPVIAVETVGVGQTGEYDPRKSEEG